MNEAPDFKNENVSSPTVTNKLIIFVIAVLILVVLGSMYYWTTFQNKPLVVPQEVAQQTTTEEAALETTTLEAESSQQTPVSSSDEISAIENDLENTYIKPIDSDLSLIKAQLGTSEPFNIISLATSLSNRIGDASVRYTSITDRLILRMGKLGEMNIDTDAAATEFLHARNSLSNGNRMLSNTYDGMYKVIQGEKVEYEWQILEANYLGAYKHLNDTKESLKEVISLIKIATAEIAEQNIVSDDVQNSEAILSEPSN